MKKRKKSSHFKLSSLLHSFAPAFFVMIISALLIGARVYADTTNFFTGCIKNSGTHNMYNIQIGTSPTSPCNAGDSQVSADYGDITGVTAGTGLSGGATQGAAVLSLSDSGVTTAKIADSAVTAVKINSGSASAGQVLTANGSGSTSWQTPASGASWGSITGTLSNQTDLQNSLNGKQDKLIAISDKHTKNLTYNTTNDLFTLSLGDGEMTGFTIYLTLHVKKGSDWLVEIFQTERAFYNDGGTLIMTTQGNSAEDNAHSAGLSIMTEPTITATLSSGVLTFKLNPGTFSSSPDSIDMDYVLINPGGKPLTFL